MAREWPSQAYPPKTLDIMPSSIWLAPPLKHNRMKGAWSREPLKSNPPRPIRNSSQWVGSISERFIPWNTIGRPWTWEWLSKLPCLTSSAISKLLTMSHKSLICRTLQVRWLRSAISGPRHTSTDAKYVFTDALSGFPLISPWQFDYLFTSRMLY